MTTADILALLGLLLTFAALMAAQWRTLQNQRDRDEEAFRGMIDALRDHVDEGLGEVHERINHSATKAETHLIEDRVMGGLRRVEEKLDRLIERQIPTPNQRVMNSP
ncbi:MAG: hypothetical protein KGL39_53500 [Patescibacteria group bacterium]|nr:hypothetical protein [Patescibacteria group bacterium]